MTAHPGLGSGALREALAEIGNRAGAPTMHYAPNMEREEQRESLNWIAERVRAALALSSPIEPTQKCSYCKVSCVPNTFACAECTKKYLLLDGERPNLLSSIPLATGRDSVTSGWTVDPAFLLELRELLSGDERPDLEAIEAVVLALNQLQTKRALPPSRQGAGGK